MEKLTPDYSGENFCPNCGNRLYLLTEIEVEITHNKDGTLTSEDISSSAGFICFRCDVEKLKEAEVIKGG